MYRLLSTLLFCFMILSLQGKERALLIGIGNYDTDKTGWTPIHGNDDVELLRGRLESHGFDVTTLKDSLATKRNVTEAISQLAAETKDGDIIYLHFSGHGQLLEDFNGDEEEGVDQSFVCYDACFSPEFTAENSSYHGQNHLIDDELYSYINLLKNNVGNQGMVVVVFDSCYSGGAERGGLSEVPDENSPVEWVETTRGTNDQFAVDEITAQYLSELEAPADFSGEGGTVLVLSACESDMKNYECRDKESGNYYGSLSYCIATLLDNDKGMDQWEDFFKNREFRQLGIFRPRQKPVVQSYK